MRNAFRLKENEQTEWYYQMDEEKRYGNYLLLFIIIASLTNAFSSHYQLTLPDSWLIELATSHTSLSKEIIVLHCY